MKAEAIRAPVVTPPPKGLQITLTHEEAVGLLAYLYRTRGVSTASHYVHLNVYADSLRAAMTAAGYAGVSCSLAEEKS